MWQDLNNDGIKELFEWRYEQNPYQNYPCIYLAIDGIRVVGMRAYVIQLFQFREINYYIFSPADLIVHPDYRRKGIFKKLILTSLNDIHVSFKDEIFILNLSSNKLSTSGYLKNGWKKLNCLKKYCYKISIKNLIKNKFIRPNVDEINISTVITKNGYDIEVTSKLNAYDIFDFVKKQRDPNKLSNIRDIKFLSWRYSYQSEKYKYVYCRKNMKMIGYLIIKNESGIQYILEEYSAIELNVLQFMINSAMKQLGIIFLRAWELSIDEKAWLGKCGFISEPAKILKLLGKERLPILIRPTSSELCDDDYFVDGLDTRNINNWKIHPTDEH
jgi:GNAT superfamily N-acetyltransferase